MITINTTDVHEGNNNGPMPEGDYEVVIKGIEEKAANSGTPYISVELVVRNDVNQGYKNKHLWYVIWASKDTHEYNAKGINTLSKHAGISNGAQFNSVAEWGNFLANKPLIATVKHDTYNGNTKEKVAYVGASKHPQCAHSWDKNVEPASTPSAPAPQKQKDDDLPF